MVRAYRLLLAEDDRDLRDVFRELLCTRAVSVTPVANGQEALELLIANASAFDAALLDVRMPLMTGLEVLREVRARSIELPILLMTSFTDDELRREATRLQAAGILQKPLEADQLLAAVLGAMGA